MTPASGSAVIAAKRRIVVRAAHIAGAADLTPSLEKNTPTTPWLAGKQRCWPSPATVGKQLLFS
jgi:hypothetical protein